MAPKKDISIFKNWNNVKDYFSDEFSVTLILKNGKRESFTYPEFTLETLNYFKNKRKR